MLGGRLRVNSDIDRGRVCALSILSLTLVMSGGKIMAIDLEHHYIPAELGRRFGLDPTKKEAVKTRDATVHAQLFDLEAQIRDMDRVGIDVAVQSCILGWDTTMENCRLINDCTARAQKDFPGRFVGLAHVAP